MPIECYTNQSFCRIDSMLDRNIALSRFPQVLTHADMILLRAHIHIPQHEVKDDMLKQ